MNVQDLKIKIFADGANLATMQEMYANPLIKGFTTNPTLMRKAGVANYEAFARKVLEYIPDRSISFEVFSDEFDEMERQAHLIGSWGDNVYIKIPVTNTRGEPTYPLIRKLTSDGLKLNVTAIMTVDQVKQVCASSTANVPMIVSVFAGRIADTGRDPMPCMSEALQYVSQNPGIELLWASPRELLNIVQADQVGCHIITATSEVLSKLTTFGKDLDEFSLDTVKMFYDDATAAGYKL